MPLMIVESPNKTKKLKAILGPGWEVKASLGHIRDLPRRSMGVEPPDFRPVYEIPDERSLNTVKQLQAAVKKHPGEVYLATDPDREGEAIAYHLEEELRLKAPKRVTFNAITEAAVKKALSAPRRTDMNQVAAQEARRVLDRLVGYTVSPALSDRLHRRASAGRVQSPALRLLTERERAIQNHVPKDHYAARLTFDDDGQAWTADWSFKQLLPEDAEPIWTDRGTAEQAAAVRSVKVIHARSMETSSNPPAPFTTSTLQQAASSALGFKPKRTMQVAQALFEQGLITYHRTDSPVLEPETVDAIRQWASAHGYELPDTPPKQTAKGDAQEAHEAIRPADVAQEEGGEDDDQRALYRLIRLRAIASQLNPARYAVNEVHLIGQERIQERPVLFIATGRRLIYEGWRILGRDDTDDSEEAEHNPVPLLEKGAELTAVDGELQEKKTRAPKRYTEAALVRALESHGIGRPSTYASIIENLYAREYMVEEKKTVRPTELGMTVAESLVAMAMEFMDLEYTRRMESELDRVANGQADYLDVVRPLHEQLTRDLGRLDTMDLPGLERHPCPACGATLRRRKSRRGDGFFWGCSSYPDCKTILTDVDGAPGGPPTAPVADESVRCPECDAAMVKRNSRNGSFYGCSRYPECNGTQDDPDNQSRRPRTRKTGSSRRRSRRAG